MSKEYNHIKYYSVYRKPKGSDDNYIWDSVDPYCKTLEEAQRVVYRNFIVNGDYDYSITSCESVRKIEREYFA